MVAFPIAVLLGVYLGILTGIIPGLVSWGLGFVVKYFTGVTIPAFGVVVFALALAGVNGGILALNDPTLSERASGPTVVTAILVVMMISLYAHSKGDAMGATFPRRISLHGLRRRTLSTDVVELVGGHSQVRLTVTGEVRDMAGYPPVPEEIRRAIREGDWTFPADLPVPELERRFAERLRTEFDFADVSVHLDEKARATVVAAPPVSGLSRRVPAGKRAVSVDALVPTGLARGDVVDLITPAGTVQGPILSARSGDAARTTPAPVEADVREPPEAGTAERAAPVHSPTTAGGEGRVTVAVSRAEVGTLLDVSRAKVVVTARGRGREYELLSELRRAGEWVRKLTVRAGGALDGVELAEANLPEAQGVAILAVRRPDGWVIGPRGPIGLNAGDELFAVGSRAALDNLEEAMA